MTTSSRLQTWLRPALRTRSVKSSQARGTWLIQRSWPLCSPDSSSADFVSLCSIFAASRGTAHDA
jgi:hypothetical protein